MPMHFYLSLSKEINNNPTIIRDLNGKEKGMQNTRIRSARLHIVPLPYQHFKENSLKILKSLEINSYVGQSLL